MKNLLLRALTITLFTIISIVSFAQQRDEVKKKTTKNSSSTAVVSVKANLRNADPANENQDSLIKTKLVELAITNNNPLLRAANDNIKIEDINLTRAKNTWLSSLSASGNVNE